MQSKKVSFVEVLINTFAGLLITILVIQPIIFYFYDVHLTTQENVTMAFWFTVASIARSYIFRRIFNYFSVRNLNKIK